MWYVPTGKASPPWYCTQRFLAFPLFQNVAESLGRVGAVHPALSGMAASLACTRARRGLSVNSSQQRGLPSSPAVAIQPRASEPPRRPCRRRRSACEVQAPYVTAKRRGTSICPERSRGGKNVAGILGRPGGGGSSTDRAGVPVSGAPSGGRRPRGVRRWNEREG